MSHAPAQLPIAVRAAMLQHLQDRRGAWPVSVLNALNDLRRRCPSCEFSDGELIDAIAEEAIDVGMNVDFDGKQLH